MNTKYIYLLASSVLLLAAGCTDEDGNGKEEPQPGLKRDAYTSVTIKLPTVSGTKAATAPGYDPGTEKEYAVKDLTLLFFRKPDEGSANEEDFVLSDVVSTVQGLSTTSGVLAVNLPSDGSGSAGAVSKTFNTGAISIDKSSVRALALLNVGKVTGLAATILKIGHSFKMINEAVQLVDISHLSGDQFLMLSAPVWKSSAMSTLTTIDPKASEEAATNAPVTIEVERAVAKVNLQAGVDYKEEAGTSYFTVADGLSHAGDKITILGWDLGNTNTYVYPFRKVNATWASDSKYSVLWGSGTGGALVSGTRIHWAEDPNYDNANWPAATFQSPSSIGDNTDWAKATKYCLENTCDFSYMYKPQVTRVIVKAKYKPNDTNQGGGNNTFDTDGTWWSFTSVAAHYSAKNMYLKIIEWIHGTITGSPNIPASADDITVSNGNLTATGGDWTITLNQTAGSISHFDLASVSYTSGGITTAVEAATINAFKSSMGQIQKYDKGICYYDIFIRHFTNVEGGYDENWTNTSGYEMAQLGRYGVVRNNWYTVTINSITQPGEPDIPTDPNLPVDTESAYINCEISIAAWAKRDHNIDL